MKNRRMKTDEYSHDILFKMFTIKDVITLNFK